MRILETIKLCGSYLYLIRILDIRNSVKTKPYIQIKKKDFKMQKNIMIPYVEIDQISTLNNP